MSTDEPFRTDYEFLKGVDYIFVSLDRNLSGDEVRDRRARSPIGDLHDVGRCSERFEQFAGQVLDATHAALPGATVTVINAGTNAQRVVTTDAEGRFTVPNLPSATYILRVELSGFRIET